jgi:hypothetical protein
MSRFVFALAFLITATSLPTFADGRSIGINFVGGKEGSPSGGTLAASDLAGVHGLGNPDLRQTNWNNIVQIHGAIPGTFGPLIDDSGATLATKLQVSFTGFTDVWSTPISANTADERLMRGYVDTILGQAQYSVVGIPYTQYDLVVYVDGDNVPRSPINDWRVAGFKANDLATLYVQDDATFNGAFVSVPPTSIADLGNNTPVGNYVVFSGLTSSSLLLTATPGSGWNPRAPLNAFQIIEAPEPSSALILLSAILGVIPWLGSRRIPSIVCRASKATQEKLV